ncbi:sensor histidine kinase [Daejeonella oryzae]|uniref:sensor histidine kinase n=1 Tax=Daejeonella oryzae TaxID=1122943 RepID=UPI00041F3327|nr:HAMP domain-containing sensor histidine kinase [Daejeonella oryzae]
MLLNFLFQSTSGSNLLNINTLIIFGSWILILGLLLIILNKSLKNKKLVSRKKELYEIISTKNQLLSIIGHDLRAPLSANHNLIQLLRTNALTDEERDLLLSNLSLSTASTVETINNIYEWGKSQLSSGQTEPRKLNLNLLAKSNFELLAEIASQKNITLINNIPADLVITGDLNQVSFIIRNLLGNAIKFSFPGTFVEISGEENGEEFIQVSVKDHGVGIADETIQKILFSEEVFSTTGTANEKGSGLGLRLSKEFIEQNGGKLSIKNNTDQGAEFFFSLRRSLNLDKLSIGY